MKMWLLDFFSVDIFDKHNQWYLSMACSNIITVESSRQTDNSTMYVLLIGYIDSILRKL